MSTFRRSLVVSLLLGILLVPGLAPAGTVQATSPCDSINGDPRPPTSPPVPTIAGTVLDGTMYTPVSGATVNLYRCQGSTPLYVTQVTTDVNGTYLFGSLSQNWYYVVVSLTGPLSGKVPSSGTNNPTNLIEVGGGATGVDLAFE